MVGNATYDFSSETAIVTGSTKGIGRGVARRLAEAGARVVINSRTPADAEATAEAIDAETQGRAVGIAADVGEPEDVDHLVETAVGRFGPIDILVNNAAVWPGTHLEGPMVDDDLDDWDHGFAVNARGAFYCAKRVAETLIEADRSGVIVNMSSRAGEPGGDGHGIYGVSKAAVNGLTWRLAYDLGPHDVRVNAISTELIDTYQLRKQLRETAGELSEDELETRLACLGDDLPLGRVGDPQVVGDAVLFLASEAARYTTGHVLHVDGGARLE
jgi:NAD(P)-dependent dehydrogenase (short-subunit alcohol dehydrogenase family)